MKPINYPHAGISFLIAMALCGTAVAEIEKFTVTAQKREENVQDVPISISTFSSDFFTRANVHTLRDLARHTPNLTLPQSNTIANQRIVMRGVGAVGNSAIEPTVGVFIDGVYYPRPSSIVGSMTDLERVEVLRGPQGTLFGRNASMGALNIVTKNPTDEYEGKISVGFGDYEERRVSGYVNGAFSETAAGRLSFQMSDRDGYGDNSYTDQGSRSTVGDWEDVTVRGKLHFAPNATTEVLVTADFSRVENGGAVTELLGDTVPAVPTVPGQDPQTTLDRLQAILPDGELPEADDPYDHNIHQMHRDDVEDEQWGLNGDITWAVGKHTLRSITAYRDWENDSLDQSFIRLPADLVPVDQLYDAETFSQELQITSPEGEDMEYVLGLYYYDEEYALDTYTHVGEDFCDMVARLFAGQPGPDAGALCRMGGPNLAVTYFDQDVKNYAAYGHMTFRLAPQWRLATGVRYTKSEKDGNFSSNVTNPFLAAGPNPNQSLPDLNHDEEKVTWMANLSHFLDADTMLFASFSTGFKSGGFNPEGFNNPDVEAGQVRRFDTETTKNYELGIKSTLMEGRLVANATLYRTEIDDFQERQDDGMNIIVRNSGDLTQQGVELDMRFQPREEFNVTLGASYLDSEFDSFPDAPGFPGHIQANQLRANCLDAGIDASRCPEAQDMTRNLTGERNHFSPKWQVALSAEWTDSLPNFPADWFVRGEYQYMDEQNVGANTNHNPDTMQDSYDLINAGAGVRGQKGDWEISVFVKNLSEEEYCQTIHAQPLVGILGLVDLETGGAAHRCSLGEPRTWSLVGSFLF